MESVVFFQAKFSVTHTGLVRLEDQLLALPLNTWQSNNLLMPVNLTADMNYAKRYRNTISQAMRAASEVLLAQVDLEVEVRSSDYIRLAAKQTHLESCSVLLKFDRQSLVDLLVDRDLSQGAQFSLQLVSEDSRSVHQKKKFTLEQLDLDAVIRFRVFRLEDVVHIVVKDEPDREFFVSLRLCELPLTFHNPFVYYIQVNTK